jgi:CTP:molybdopterin cytidylyltransferase MocA
MQGIVLAAGLGGRMGGRKARLLLGEVPLVAAHVARLRDAGARRVVAVLRGEDEVLVRGEAHVAISSEPDPSGSLARGIDGLATGDDVVIVTPVDMLPASVATLRALEGAVLDGAAAAVPTVGGKGGHPVAVRASVLSAGRGRPLREVLAALGARCSRIEVGDPAVLTDLDAPEDVERLLGGPVRFSPMV